MTSQNRNGIKQNQFESHYQAKKTPWDPGRPDFNLVEGVTQNRIESCQALDIGSGSGHNSIWLAHQGFQVTGVDVAETALEKARKNAAEAKAICNFLSLSFLEQDVPGAPFGFIFDRGCWHLLDREKRETFAARAARHLVEDGLWLSISGSADEPPRGPDPLAGPPRRSALDIAAAVEPYFEILNLRATRFDSNNPKPPKAWSCLMRERNPRRDKV